MKNKLLIIFLSIIFIFSCEKNENKIKINTKNILKTDSIKIADENKIRVAVSAMVSPKNTFKYYKEILDYIGKKLGKEVELVQRKSYHEVNKLLENKEIDFAFVCSGPYVTGKKDFGMQLLAVPVVHGETVYYSYIIVHKNSGFKKFEDLKQTKFAFTDPKSNTGCLVPTYELSKINQSPETFFESIKKQN